MTASKPVSAGVAHSCGLATDGTAYASVGNFATTFAAARYIKFSPNETLPVGATITGAQVQLAYKSSTAGDTTCWYFEVYNGATLIGTVAAADDPAVLNAVDSCPMAAITVEAVEEAAQAAAERPVAAETGSISGSSLPRSRRSPAGAPRCPG